MVHVFIVENFHCKSYLCHFCSDIVSVEVLDSYAVLILTSGGNLVANLVPLF